MKLWMALALLASGTLGAQTPPSPLVDAAKQDDAAAALAQIAAGADVNAPTSDGTTALHWAVHHDDGPLIDALLKAHANPKATNDYGATPMSEAAIFGDTAVIE